VEPDSDRLVASVEPSDEELAKLAQRGDIESGNHLFLRHGAELERLARSLLHPRLSDDILKETIQDAYRIAWETFSSFGPPYHFVPWVHQILRNVSRNKSRTVKTEGQIFGPKGSDENIDEVEDRRAGHFQPDRLDPDDR
jgi:DNA-directed RNA polymerase specialized sigma24 family protein